MFILVDDRACDIAMSSIHMNLYASILTGEVTHFTCISHCDDLVGRGNVKGGISAL